MKTSKIILWSIIDALGVAVYVTGVSLLISNAERIFGKMTGFLGPMAMLLLLVISAAITGSLVFGRPVYMIYNGQKKEGLKLLFYTIGFLVLITITVFITLIAIK
jgi:hypothetical protein